MRKEYEVPVVEQPLHFSVEVPGSKSMTNRALLLAAMAEGASVLKGVLFSEDSEVFLQALLDLGFELGIDREKKQVEVMGTGGKIPEKKADIFVGSAGTAARFLTAFLAMSDGSYYINATEQMKKRPMKELLLALEELGAVFEYQEKPYHFPFLVKGVSGTLPEREVSLNIDRSSQFLSALLLVSPLRAQSLRIHLTGTRKARSYVEMTEQMMKAFSHPGVKKLGENDYEVEKNPYHAREYEVEPDVSAACYFYAVAAVTGGSAVVKRMKKDSLQGDMRFLEILQEMGCRMEWKPESPSEKKESLYVYGPAQGKLHGFDASFCDFSDQALTAAAIAPFADSPVTIRGIAHTRGQESDRMAVMKRELGKMGVICEMEEDRITIYPGQPHGATIHTYQDHRVAMAFAVAGLRTKGIVIQDPACCKKTFPEYFEKLDEIVGTH